MKPSNASMFHLLVENAHQFGVPPLGGPLTELHPHALPLPEGVSSLRAPRDAAPEIHAEIELANRALVLEPVITREGAPRLALVNPGDNAVSVNGLPAPRFSLLQEKDQFSFDDSCVFHVAIFHSPKIGPAPADKLGKPCPICLAPFTNDPKEVTYQCRCHTVLHLEGPAGLECARAVQTCPHCGAPVRVRSGYTWLPEFCHE